MSIQDVWYLRNLKLQEFFQLFSTFPGQFSKCLVHKVQSVIGTNSSTLKLKPH